MPGGDGDPRDPVPALKEPSPAGEVSRALLQPEVELCLDGGNKEIEVIKNLLVFPEQDLPQGLHVRNSLSARLSQAGGHLLGSGIPSGKWAAGEWEEAGTSPAWELRRWTPQAPFPVATVLSS